MKEFDTTNPASTTSVYLKSEKTLDTLVTIGEDQDGSIHLVWSDRSSGRPIFTATTDENGARWIASKLLAIIASRIEKEPTKSIIEDFLAKQPKVKGTPLK